MREIKLDSKCAIIFASDAFRNVNYLSIYVPTSRASFGYDMRALLLIVHTGSARFSQLGNME